MPGRTLVGSIDPRPSRERGRGTYDRHPVSPRDLGKERSADISTAISSSDNKGENPPLPSRKIDPLFQAPEVVIEAGLRHADEAAMTLGHDDAQALGIVERTVGAETL